ncbi:M28 family metallopeptidase [Sphingomonas sp. ID0503]|uniref:M28 family metallopeptidase n=1 Tax=Sphingomonas sp. ID0503 TaxID=3399691 RepID=UPI003AFA466F
MTLSSRAAALALCLTTAVPALAAPAISVETLKEVTKTLSSDEFEGRAPGTPGEDKSIKLIAERFEKAGLKPGANGKWYQDVPMVEITAQPGMTLAFSGGKAPVTLAYKTDMVVATRQVQQHIAVKDSDVVFVGYGVNAPELGWNDYAGVDVKGKTVVILINDPDWETKTLDGPFGGRAMTYYGRWTYKYEEAARQGAAAAIIVHDTEPAAYGFNVVVSSWTGPQIELDAANGYADQSKAIGWMTGDAATKVFAAAGRDLAQMKAAAKVKGFKAVPLGLKLSTAFNNETRKTMSHNVVGILPGKKRADEYVLLSAHWDHLGRCEPVNGDDICNGAYDNASGTAGLIALAEANAKAGPADRSIVFLAVTAEESGLLGSGYYAANPLYPLGQTVGGVNLDGVSIYGASKDVTITGPGKSELDTYVTRAAAAQNQTVQPEPTPEKGYYYRSDHFSFAKRGVPMAYFENGLDLVNGGTARGKAVTEAYTAAHYHAPSDEYHDDWDWSGGVQELSLTYNLARELADSDAWPNWSPTAEFRAIRDKSRAGK